MEKVKPLPCPKCGCKVVFYHTWGLKNIAEFKIFCSDYKCQESYFYTCSEQFKKKTTAHLLEIAWLEWNNMQPELEKYVCAEKI